MCIRDRHSIDQLLKTALIEDLKLARHAAVRQARRRDLRKLHIVLVKLFFHHLLQHAQCQQLCVAQ